MDFEPLKMLNGRGTAFTYLHFPAARGSVRVTQQLATYCNEAHSSCQSVPTISQSAVTFATLQIASPNPGSDCLGTDASLPVGRNSKQKEQSTHLKFT